jgi:hypothetical protein
MLELVGMVADHPPREVEKLIEIGAKAVSHGRYVAFQMAEVAVSRRMFAGIFVADRPIEDTTRATKAGIAADPELAQHAAALRSAVANAGADKGGADIEVGSIIGKVNVLVDNLVANGRIKLGDLRAETGDATLTNLTAGATAPKKA